MFNPENAYQDLTDEQKKVSDTAIILPSGEAHFDGFNSGDNKNQIPHPTSGINAIYDVGPSSGNLELIHKNQTTQFGNPNPSGILSSRLAPLFGYSELSSSEQSRNRTPRVSMANLNPYIHYYPIVTTNQSSLYNSAQEVQAAFNIQYNTEFDRSIKYNPYN